LEINFPVNFISKKSHELSSQIMLIRSRDLICIISFVNFFVEN